MAAKKPVDSGEPKLNREERRRQKFGGGRANAETAWPTQRPNPVFTEHTTEEAAKAATPATPATPAPAAAPAAKPAPKPAAAPDTAEG